MQSYDTRKGCRGSKSALSCSCHECGHESIFLKTGKTEIGAYFSVEAAFIMSIVLVCIVLVIYTAFYMYDRCLLTQDSYILCFRESLVKNRSDQAQELLEKAENQFGKKYFAVTNRSVEASCTSTKVICNSYIETAHTLFGGSDIMSALEWKIHVSGSSRKTDPAYHIRLYRRIRYLAGTAAGEINK